MSFSTRIQRYLKRNSIADSNSLIFPAAAVCLAGLLSAVSVAATPFDNGFEEGFPGWDEPPLQAESGEVVIVGPQSPEEFPVYDDLGVGGFDPYNGDLMLRMGTPKSSNETQPRGVNRISQTFTATSAQISVALRLFSIDHRGDDILRFSLVSDADVPDVPDVSSSVFDFGNGMTTCSNPCEEVIDVGKRKDVIAPEDWQVVDFDGLVPGEVYTLTIELEAGQNESLASWLYVDGGNEAPTAVINYNPKAPVEGDFVVLDCLGSEDPEGSELSCTWSADFGGDVTEITGNTVVYWARDGEKDVPVTLTVSDGEESTTAPSTVVHISDQPALVSGLDVEVLVGGTVDLVCRYVDPGIDDAYTIQFDVTSGPLDYETHQYAEESDPSLASGYARVRYQAPDEAGEYTESCSVGGSSADFNISVLDSVPDRTAALLGSIDSAPAVDAGQSILGNLEIPENIAVYELRDSMGNEFTQGTEVVVTAHFPVDYDIVLLSGSKDQFARPWASAPFVSAPFVSVPFVSVPFVSVPFVSVPFVSVPFVSVPFVSAPFVSAPFVSAPFVSVPLTTSLWRTPGFFFQDFPLSQLAGAPDGSNISGADISFGDLGALNAGSLANAPVFLKGLSANFGTNTEQALVKVGPGEDGLYLAVIPQSGSFSAAPFNIEVEAAIPPETASLLGEKICGPFLTPLVTPSIPETILGGYSGGTTLVVTQKERMVETFFDGDPVAFDNWLADMGDFFTHPKVDATVISVPSGLYDNADKNPCDVQAQNAVAEGIKAVIKKFRDDHPNTKYVQIMGSLDIVPPYYVPDETQTGNESLFASDLLTRPGTPLGAAIAEGYMLTDAFYVDEIPQPFNGRQLYLEDISVSRMVETPDEILANAQRFYDTDGVISLLSAQPRSTGYDFFIDGTKEINSVLGISSPDDTLLNDTWNAVELRCLFFGTGEGCNKSVSTVNAINAHMSYNAGLTAKGFGCQYLKDGDCPDSELGEVFLSSESADILVNGVTFSIGCHSGLSVPDAWGLPKEFFPVDPAGDWVQELGTWVGSYNFAYGDTDVADRGTEGIMPLVIAKFAGGIMTLGEALVEAKQQYGAGLFEFGVYDEKSLVGLSLFGMPQATLSSQISLGATVSAFAASTLNATPAGNLVIDYTEDEGDAPAATNGSIEMQSNPDKGVSFTVNGQAQAIVGRPLLPAVKTFELRPVDGTTTHGVALRGGTYTIYRDLDPVFPAQTHDLVTRISEPQPCVKTLSPTLLASVNRFESPDGSSVESLVVQPGQFECTNDAEGGEAVMGDFRIWNTLNLDLLHPIEGASDADLRPPQVIQQDLLRIPNTDDVSATLAATDVDDSGISSGMREIIALVYSDEGVADGSGGIPGMATAYSMPASDGEPVVFTLEDAFDKQLSFQYIDNAGNITAKTLKGALLRAIEVSIETSFITLGSETLILVEIGDFCSLVAPYVTIDFGDGSSEVIELDDPEPPCLDSSEGSRTIVIAHTYDGSTGTDPVTIEVEVRASGAVGTDTKTINVDFCDPPFDAGGVPGADIIGCSVSPDTGKYLKIAVVVYEALSPDVQYRLILPQTNTQIKYSDGATTGPNKIKPTADAAGNVITFRFDAGKLGWDGESPFEFLFETQQGVSGGAGQGFVDETDVKIYQR